MNKQHNRSEAERDAVANEKTSGCQRGHSAGRYLYVFLSSSWHPERVIFLLSDITSGGAVYLFMRSVIFSGFGEVSGPERENGYWSLGMGVSRCTRYNF